MQNFLRTIGIGLIAITSLTACDQARIASISNRELEGTLSAKDGFVLEGLPVSGTQKIRVLYRDDLTQGRLYLIVGGRPVLINIPSGSKAPGGLDQWNLTPESSGICNWHVQIKRQAEQIGQSKVVGLAVYSRYSPVRYFKVTSGIFVDTFKVNFLESEKSIESKAQAEIVSPSYHQTISTNASDYDSYYAFPVAQREVQDNSP